MLYLAIVAIWAIFLIPRWIRRSHPTLQAEGGPAEATDDAAPDGPAEVEFVDETEPVLAAEADYPIDDGYPADDGYPGADDEMPYQAPPRPGRGRLGSWRGLRRRDRAAAKERPAAATRPPLSRSQALRARRRMLTTLLMLMAVAAGCYAAKLAPWWVCVPPAGMLGMYLLLLREAALADAEQARWRAEESALRVRAARQRARQEWAERAAQPIAEPSAEIIDISGRVGDDQFYDQYADPPARAIGN